MSQYLLNITYDKKLEDEEKNSIQVASSCVQCDQGKNRQMSTKVAQKWKILKPLQKMPKNWGDLGKLIVAKGF